MAVAVRVRCEGLGRMNINIHIDITLAGIVQDIAVPCHIGGEKPEINVSGPGRRASEPVVDYKVIRALRSDLSET